MLRTVTELRDIDLALASYPESEWAELAGPPLLARLRDRVGIEEDELRGAVRRSLLLAAAAGDPNEALEAADARARGGARRRARERRPAARPRRCDPRRPGARHRRAPAARRVGAARARGAAHEDPQLAWRLFCAALLAAAALEE